MYVYVCEHAYGCMCVGVVHSQGGDLDQKIRQLQETGQSLGEMLIVDWFIQLTTAIMYIHERRILHRDLKTRYTSIT